MEMARIVGISPRPRLDYDRNRYANEILDMYNPARIFDQYFGMAIPEQEPRRYPATFLGQRPTLNRQLSGRSEVRHHSNQFQVNLDVNQFTPEELSVKVVGDCVVVHGKHEERSDEHGFISREFTRRYVLPEGVEAEKVASSLSRGGVLTIEAPLRELEAPVERNVPITSQVAVPEVSSADKKDS